MNFAILILVIQLIQLSQVGAITGGIGIICQYQTCDDVSCGFPGWVNNSIKNEVGLCSIQDCALLINNVSNNACKSCYSNETSPPRIYAKANKMGCCRSNCNDLIASKYGWTSTSCIDCYDSRFRAYDNKTGCFNLEEQSNSYILNMNVLMYLITFFIIL